MFKMEIDRRKEFMKLTSPFVERMTCENLN